MALSSQDFPPVLSIPKKSRKVVSPFKGKKAPVSGQGDNNVNPLFAIAPDEVDGATSGDTVGLYEVVENLLRQQSCMAIR